MKRYEISIKGVVPCLMNKLDNDMNKEIKEVPRDKLDQWEKDNWKRKAYWDSTGNKIKIPDTNIHGMFISACKKYKISPPKSIGRTWTDYFKSSVIIESSDFTYESIEPFGCMVNGNPSAMKKSSKVFKYRPKFNGWVMNIILVDLQDYLSNKSVEEITATAGKFIGFGDWRPQQGRFEVVKIKAI